MKWFWVLFFPLIAYAAPPIVFVHIGGGYPSYIETAVEQAALFNPESPIYLVVGTRPYKKLQKRSLPQNVSLINYELLGMSDAHRQFLRRAGAAYPFWLWAMERFFYLDELIHERNLCDVIHLENDVMLYANIEEIISKIETIGGEIAAPFDNDSRCIPGIVYIRSPEASRALVTFFSENGTKKQSDMELLSSFRYVFPVVPFPVIPPEYAEMYPLQSNFGHTTPTPEHYYRLTPLFGGIFDAAALGQYLGGDVAHQRPGFINERALFNPSYMTYSWKTDTEGRKIPYAHIQGTTYRIYNLHIHSKNLASFSSH